MASISIGSEDDRMSFAVRRTDTRVQTVLRDMRLGRVERELPAKVPQLIVENGSSIMLG
jgi:hypothetical protein